MDNNEELRDMERTISGGTRFAESAIRFYTMLKNQMGEIKNSLSELYNNKVFLFNGNITDLGYFYNNKILPLNYINEIEEVLVKNQVKKVFEKTTEDGLTAFDGENYTLTDKGYEYISTPEFAAEVAKEQELGAKEVLDQLLKDQQQEPEQKFEYEGNESDLGTFFTAKEVNIKDFENIENKELAEKIKNNFEKLRQKDLVDINDEGVITITEKGTEFIENKDYINAFGEEIEKRTHLNEIIGACEWHNGEKLYYTDSEKFLQTVADEIEYTPTSGFDYEILTGKTEIKDAVEKILIDKGFKEPTQKDVEKRLADLKYITPENMDEKIKQGIVNEIKQEAIKSGITENDFFDGFNQGTYDSWIMKEYRAKTLDKISNKAAEKGKNAVANKVISSIPTISTKALVAAKKTFDVVSVMTKGTNTLTK